MAKPSYWNKAKKYLSKKDKTLAKLISKYKGSLVSRDDAYYSLLKSIVGQQISVAAANSVWKKLEKKARKIRPLKISKLSKRQLSSCGLSRQKIEYIRIITKKFIDKSICIKKLKQLNDEEAIKYLSTIKGVGKWTAEMFLFFNQLRPDIFPIQDIGLLRAISIHYKTKYPPSSDQLNYFKRKWSPYCTVATWYLWRSIDPVPVKY
ncbi:MAG: DNA-3-methyladenine glycosylase [Candidatus Pelagibacter sp.]|nr:DNA-3-methyladenine glycosylase [Candidatus Pelagibacter sp.]OUV98497.1 MAG: DNA-3-methyladenine glycosylase [Candidatus Pelagibacter sp. TMED142]|tara:strand:+ start:253 stop:870 length:618 start_codon:yes stop_codon:yes gene_type:complete